MCVLQTRTMFASVPLDHVLEPLQCLAWYTKRCPCISAVPKKATREVEGPLKGFVSAQKSPSRVQGEGVAEMNRRANVRPLICPTEKLYPFFYKTAREKNELVARLSTLVKPDDFWHFY